MPFDRRVGNDARFVWSLRDVDPFAAGCPAASATTGPDGYVHVAAEAYFSVNGVELRPDDGATYAIDFADYPACR